MRVSFLRLVGGAAKVPVLTCAPSLSRQIGTAECSCRKEIAGPTSSSAVWERLIRNKLTPSASRRRMTLGLRDAGPTVQITFVETGGIVSCLTSGIITGRIRSISGCVAILDSCSGRVCELQPCSLGEPAHNRPGLQEQFGPEIGGVEHAHEA